jgi:hypothetical protein
MFNWRSRIVIVAGLAAGCTGALVAGCTGKITGGSPTGSTGSGGGSGSSTGTGSTGTVSTGTGSTGVVNTTGTGSSTGTVGSTTPGVCTPGIPATLQVPRLTNTEYDRTIRDLLGVTELKAAANVYPSTLLATDQAGGLTDLGWSAYQSVAEMIASQVMASSTLTANFLKCTPTTTGSGATCLHNTIVQFGRRAFRRPLTTDEVAAFDAIVSKGAQITPTGAPSELAEALLYMFLISPSFLQHAEITGTADSSGHYSLSPWEVAARLSYMLWGTTPDDTLSAAADNNQLTTSAQILTQAQRMLQDPKAHDMVSDFHRFYLIMGTNTRWDQINKNTTLFPAFSTAVVPDMENETQQFFDEVVFKYGGSFQDFFLSPRAYVTAATAPFYGLKAASYGTALTEVDLDATQRPGFLTRLAFLNAYSSYSNTSPILRGAFINKQLLGVPIGAPPPGADQTPLPTSADLDTIRKEVDQMTSASACSSCHHNYINPPGFALEAFNTVGTWQAKDTSVVSTGVSVDTTADVMIDGAPVHVTGPADLMAALAKSAQAQQQYATLWVAYAYQRSDAMDCGTVNSLSAKMTAGGYAITNLVADLTQTASFVTRAQETP